MQKYMVISREQLFFPIAVGFVVALLVAMVFGAYQYREKIRFASSVASLHAQLSSVATILERAEYLTEEDRNLLAGIQEGGAVLAGAPEPLTEVVSKASPAVVSIAITRDIPLLDIEYINPFGDDPLFSELKYRVPVFKRVGTEEKQVGAGTGFLIHADGYILTNRHVVNSDEAGYTVLLSTGEKKTARVVYRDDEEDIAVVKIEGSGYPTLRLGDSRDLKLGQSVAAIGNALGAYNNTISVGIISGLDRTVEAWGEDDQVATLAGVIQTDAAINRGNSGGPLLDLSGAVVGINVAMETGASNIAFAIPINSIKESIERIIK